MPECLLEGWAGKLDEVVIALPQVCTERTEQVTELLRSTGLKIYVAPGLAPFWCPEPRQRLAA
jgi:hypothetical protein